MNQTNMKNTLKSNVIKLQENPLYIKKLVKGKSLNLFGAPVPEDTIIKNFSIFRKIIKSYK